MCGLPSVLRSKEHRGHCVYATEVIGDAEDLGCSIAVPDRKDAVTATRVVEDGLIEDVVCIAGISLVSRQMGGDDDCEVVTSPLKAEGVGVGLRCPRLNTCIDPVPDARGDDQLTAVEKTVAW